MKKTVLAALILAAGAAVADAQVSFRYHREGDNYRLDIWGGFGYGGGYGYGGFAPGFVWNGGNSSFAFGTNFLGTNYYGPGWYGYYPAYGYYARRARYQDDGRTAADYYAMRYTAVRRAQAHGVPESVQRLTVEKHLAIGVQKWRSADYAGALASFKEAVGTDTSHGLAQVYMGLALVAAGDLRNAEKAVAGGLPSADLGAIDFKAMFRDAKEQSRYAAALEKAGPLAAGTAFALLGDRAKAVEKAKAAGKAGQPLLDFLK